MLEVAVVEGEEEEEEGEERTGLFISNGQVEVRWAGERRVDGLTCTMS